MVLTKAISQLGTLTSRTIWRRSFTFGPPKNRISLQEKILLWSGAMVIITGPMLWVMAHLKEYQGKE